MRLLPALIGATLAAALTVPSAAPAQAGSAYGRGSPVVRTDKGSVQGVRAQAVESFLGIRYAAPPVGELRWRAPQPVAAWQGVQPASSYGARCAAAESTNGSRTETEDCLFINVQRPAGKSGGARLPVYVFIHGGGLVNGSSNQADMAAIVRQTGVIGVTFNYRLGVFGFLGLPALTAESGESGNYGFQDQQAALSWVQRNIGAFGGDPGRVTVGGESAGGFSVCGHLVAPASQRLLNQAMIQSGACPSRTQQTAEASGTAFATALGCTDLACLRAVPAGRLLDTPASGFALVRGTPTLPVDPRVAVASGDFHRVPLVIGANRDEGRTFAQGFIGQTREQYEQWVTTTVGADVLARYPWPATSGEFTAAYLVGAIMTDSGMASGIGGCTNRALIRDFERWTRTYAYEFAHRTGPGLTPIPGYVWGAGHAAELAYLFPSFNNGTPIAPTFDRSERQLAREMKHDWATFVRTGTPGWPRIGYRSLRAGGDSVQISDARYVAEHQCDFWDARTSRQRVLDRF